MDKNSQFYFQLTPEKILDFVENAIAPIKQGIRATGRTLALNSLENRVYEIDLDDNSQVVVKFYRPGRWSKECILEEHRFVLELEKNEVPVVSPMMLANQSTLMDAVFGDTTLYFAVFPKVRGKIKDEMTREDYSMIGRLLARLHNVGSGFELKHRQTLSVQSMAEEPLKHLFASGLIPANFQPAYQEITSQVLAKVRPIFDQGFKRIAIHGDCHLGNVLWNFEKPFFLDFDDMVSGPAVQDLWLTIRGREEEDLRNRDFLISSYESMRVFDSRELKLIEPLRALRVIHYNTWIARRWDDPIFKNMFPEFGSTKYWQAEISDLYQQLDWIG